MPRFGKRLVELFNRIWFSVSTGIEHRDKYLSDRLLYHAIGDRGDAEWPGTPAVFGNLDPLDCTEE